MSHQIELTPGHIRKLLSAIDAGLVKGLGTAMPGHMCVEAAVCYALGLPHGDDPKCVAPAIRALVIGINDADWPSPQERAAGMRRLALAQLGSLGAIDESEFVQRAAKMTIRTVVPKALRNAARLQVEAKHEEALIAAAQKCETDGSACSAADASDAADAAGAAARSVYATRAADAARAAYAVHAVHAARTADAAVAVADAVADADAAADAAVRAASAAAYAAADASDAAGAAYSAADAANATADAAAHAAYAATAATFVASCAARDAVDDLSAFTESVVQILIDMKSPGCEWLEVV